MWKGNKNMELGNMMFNPNKNQQYECPEWIIALLNKIDAKLCIMMFNKTQREYESPFGNTGNTFKNDVFEVQAYNWDDDIHQEYNFKCGDIEISWYKYLGRDTTINDDYNEEYIIEMFNKCIKSLKE